MPIPFTIMQVHDPDGRNGGVERRKVERRRGELYWAYVGSLGGFQHLDNDQRVKCEIAAELQALVEYSQGRAIGSQDLAALERLKLFAREAVAKLGLPETVLC